MTWQTYYTVCLWYVPNGTQWHPHEPSGPFAELTRGAFRSELAARLWCAKNIPGHAFDLARVECETDGNDTFERFVGSEALS